MVNLQIPWDLFIDSVEGRQGSMSCSLVDGQPVWNPTAIQRDSKQNLSLLADFLRGGYPMPDKIRIWLADLFDPQPATELYVQALTRRRPGYKKLSISGHWEAAQFFCEQMEMKPNPGPKTIRHDTAVRFDISESTLKNAVIAYKKAMKEHDIANE